LYLGALKCKYLLRENEFLFRLKTKDIGLKFDRTLKEIRSVLMVKVNERFLNGVAARKRVLTGLC
jgi:hypothetical protein